MLSLIFVQIKINITIHIQIKARGEVRGGEESDKDKE
jgi:hypothetical protein